MISADHQNKPDVATGIASKWFDVDHVDMITDVPTSSVALALMQVGAQKNKALIYSGPGSSDITGSKCNANTVHWTYDTWMLANGTGKAIVKNGGDTWFFITADYAFGHALERDTAAVVEANGGKVLGKVRAPINTSDFSSFLLQAQQSKAKIIGLANAGGDTINAIKQGAEFGIVGGRPEIRRLADFRAGHPGARAKGRTRSDVHRDLLLGHERWDPGLDQALGQGAQCGRQAAEHEYGWRLFRHARLP